MAKKYQLTQDGPEVQALLDKVEGLKANQTPEQGTTPTALETLALEGVLYSVVTKAVSDLVNYYTKSETYTKSEVNTMVAAIKSFSYEPVTVLPTASAETMWKLYLVPSSEPKSQNIQDEYITVDYGPEPRPYGLPRYDWEQIGSTAIDLSGYVTTDALNTALADYATSDALETALAGLNDVKYTPQSLTDSQKAQARTNIGATAPEVFWATYGVTTAQEIRDAIAADKICMLVYLGRTFYFSGDLVGSASYNFLWFMCMQNDQSWYARVRSDTNQWSSNYSNLEKASNKSQSVETDKTSTTKYPSTKAVADAITAGKQIFWAEYGVTTYNEVVNAYNGGKFVVVKRDNGIVYKADFISNPIKFGGWNALTQHRLELYDDNRWIVGSSSAEIVSNKSQSVETDKTSQTKYPTTKAVWDELKVRPVIDETSQETVPSLNLENTANKSQDVQTDRESVVKYPSVKAVFDALGKWGVISQTISWTGSSATGWDKGNTTNIVWGLIPKSFIDSVTTLDPNATFNTETGYFEYKGVNDISYQEMLVSYTIGDVFIYNRAPGAVGGYTGDKRFRVLFANQSMYGATLWASRAASVFNIGINGGNYLEVMDFGPAIINNGRVAKWAGDGYDNIAAFPRVRVFKNINFEAVTTAKDFSKFYSLETCEIFHLKANINIGGSSRLTLASVVYMVNYAANGSTAITITLHATAYARCQADTTEYTYNGQTYVGVIAYANAKNITIASA